MWDYSWSWKKVIGSALVWYKDKLSASGGVGDRGPSFPVSRFISALSLLSGKGVFYVAVYLWIMNMVSPTTRLLIFSWLIFPLYEAEKMRHRGLRQKDAEYIEKVRGTLHVKNLMKVFRHCTQGRRYWSGHSDSLKGCYKTQLVMYWLWNTQLFFEFI